MNAMPTGAKKAIEFIAAAKVMRMTFGKSRNFVTPDIIDMGKVPTGDDEILYFELSSGRGFYDSTKTYWGVTIVEVLPGGETKRRMDLNGVFYARNEAETYIANGCRNIEGGIR